MTGSRKTRWSQITGFTAFVLLITCLQIDFKRSSCRKNGMEGTDTLCAAPRTAADTSTQHDTVSQYT